MDYYWNGKTTNGDRQRRMFVPVYGVITQIQDIQNGNGKRSGCTKMVTVEEADGSIADFVVSPATYILDQVTLYESLPVVMFYDPLMPMPLIYPPQYRAVIAGEQVPGVNVAAGYFDRQLLNADQTLQLNTSDNTVIVTANNQTFTQNPGGRELIVLYEETTRSIPAQTTPVKIIVMC